MKYIKIFCNFLYVKCLKCYSSAYYVSKSTHEIVCRFNGSFWIRNRKFGNALSRSASFLVQSLITLSLDQTLSMSHWAAKNGQHFCKVLQNNVLCTFCYLALLFSLKKSFIAIYIMHQPPKKINFCIYEFQQNSTSLVCMMPFYDLVAKLLNLRFSLCLKII